MQWSYRRLGGLEAVSNEQLWAPWRLGYILGEKSVAQPCDAHDLLDGGRSGVLSLPGGARRRRPAAAGRRSGRAYRHPAEPIPIQQRASAGGPAAAPRPARRAWRRTAVGAVADDHPDGGRAGKGAPAAGVQRGLEPRPRGRGRRARPPPLAHRSPLDRRHELHAHHRRRAHHPAVAGSPVGVADGGVEGTNVTERNVPSRDRRSSKANRSCRTSRLPSRWPSGCAGCRRICSPRSTG